MLTPGPVASRKELPRDRASSANELEGDKGNESLSKHLEAFVCADLASHSALNKNFLTRKYSVYTHQNQTTVASSVFNRFPVLRSSIREIHL